MSHTLSRDDFAAGALAAAVHGFFFLLLVFGLSWQIHDPQPVMADLWQALPEPQRPAPPEPRKPLPEPESTPAPDNKEAEIALEKKKQEELKKKREEEADKKRREEEYRKVQERLAAEKKQAEEKLRALQREEEGMQRRLQEQAAAVDASRIRAQQAAMQRAAEVDGIVARYRDMISAKIRGNTRLPPNLPGNPEVEFDVRLLPTGEIVGIALKKGSGIAAYDEAVRRGIEKSSPLPLPTDRDAAAEFRSLEIKHRARE